MTDTALSFFARDIAPLRRTFLIGAAAVLVVCTVTPAIAETTEYSGDIRGVPYKNGLTSFTSGRAAIVTNEDAPTLCAKKARKIVVYSLTKRKPGADMSGWCGQLTWRVGKTINHESGWFHFRQRGSNPKDYFFCEVSDECN